jgi:hypothetical protein
MTSGHFLMQGKCTPKMTVSQSFFQRKMNFGHLPDTGNCRSLTIGHFVPGFDD